MRRATGVVSVFGCSDVSAEAEVAVAASADPSTGAAVGFGGSKFAVARSSRFAEEEVEEEEEAEEEDEEEEDCNSADSRCARRS